MMRWLKDKKREKRSSSLGYDDDDDDDDDYGFEKERTAAQGSSKSPVIKRQLPPTPLTPEEKSPHIYEEIYDGQVIGPSSLLSENQRGSRQRVKRLRHTATVTSGEGAVGPASVSSGSYIASSSTSSKYIGRGNDVTLSSSSIKDDSISPYMVVPVDEEVRQTPTNFHRNGTPEVHCDVIVKETHCEILLSRKPKVSAFKPDPATSSVDNSNNSNVNNMCTIGNPVIRNNTHFCSRNRRASMDVNSMGGKSNTSSSGAWNSSAFSSSSTSRVNSVGASMMSLSTLSERDRLPTLDDNASSGSSAKGVLTYTVGGNFIQRSTKLTFNPLKPVDGDDTSLSNRDPFFSMMLPPSSDSSVFEDNAPPSAISNPDSQAGHVSNKENINNSIVYSAMSPPPTNFKPNANNSNSSNKIFPPPQPANSLSKSDLEYTATPKSFNNNNTNKILTRDPVPTCKAISNSNPALGYSLDIPEKPFHSIIRASSPSNASTCTYASVSFPAEPKIYNTIAPDLVSQETTRDLQSHTVLRHLESSVEGDSETESVRYSSIQDPAHFGNIGVHGNQGNQTTPNSIVSKQLSGNITEPFQFALGRGVDDPVYSGVMAYRIDNNSSSNVHSNQGSGFFSGKKVQQQQQHQHHQFQPEVHTRCDQTCHSNLNHQSVNVVTHDFHNPLQNVPADESSGGVIYTGIMNENDDIDIDDDNNSNNDNNSSTLYACIENASGLDHNDMDLNNLMQNPEIITSTMSSNTTDVVKNPGINNSLSNIDTSEADVDRLLYGEAVGIAATHVSMTSSAAVAAAAASNILLDFCTCSDDQHSSVCGGFLDGKAADDDTSSIATTINEPRDSCTGCGRLIRQITYSESYSDETYEHVYSSRLLLRRGRRFSSPDITMSEISNSEANRELDDVKGQCHFGAMSRDDTWMTSRHDDAGSTTFYSRPVESETKAETALFSNSAPLQSDVLLRKETSIRNEVKMDNPQPPPVPSSKPRQSFCAFSSTKNQKDLLDKTSNVSSIAHHRSSLPVINPSNLVPVTDIASLTTTSQLQTKSSAFSNLFSKFSRPKPKHPNKINDVGSAVDSVKPGQKLDDSILKTNVNANAPSHETPSEASIPDKNTTKLSKFFQRLANNDSQEVKEEVKITKDKKREDDFKTKSLKVEIPENSSIKTVKLLRSPSEPKSYDPFSSPLGNSLSAFKGNSKLSPNDSKPESSSNPNLLATDEKTKSLLDLSEGVSQVRPSNRIIPSHTNTNEALVDSIIMGESKASSTSTASGLVTCNDGADQRSNANVNPDAASKPPNKTDSGDTCYEYDISTSSEGEQTNYDYFLSKVKKSLNLEHEVQQIADMNALRKKMFCKKCKKSDMYGSGLAMDNDDNESVGSDAGCPQLSAKFGDLRKIFGDFVVDQRAAILDCLTDYAHGPFNVRGEGRDNTCRGCGGEIMTSDSESMTTVYTILSQQFRMTSPGTHTPSCDSDDGTMADNSCESADEEDNDVSSGYDEAIGPISEHYPTYKTKRKEKTRERKERKLHHSSGSTTLSCRDQEKLTKKKSCNHASKLDGNSGEINSYEKQQKYDCVDIGKNKHFCNENKYQIAQKQVHSSKMHTPSLAIVQKSSYEKGDSQNPSMIDGTGQRTNTDTDDLQPRKSGETEESHSNPNSNKSNNSTKPKPRLLASEKVIQDIYAPLPSKALSWLTARNSSCYSPNTNSNNNNSHSHNSDANDSVYSCSSSAGLNPLESSHAATLSDSVHCGVESSGNTKTGEIPPTLTPNDKPKVLVGGMESSMVSCSDDTITSSSDNNNNNNSNNGLDPVHTGCDIPQLKAPNDSSTILRVGGSGHIVNEKDPTHKKSGYFDPESLSELRRDEISCSLVSTLKNPMENKNCVMEDEKQSKDKNKDVSIGSQTRKPELLTSRQKQKQLQMAALDLLPETALGGDTEEVVIATSESEDLKMKVTSKSQLSGNEIFKSDYQHHSLSTPQQQQQQQQQRQPQQQQQQGQEQQLREQQQHRTSKSNMVERLAKMFEDNNQHNSTNAPNSPSSSAVTMENSSSRRKMPSKNSDGMFTVPQTTTTNDGTGTTIPTTHYGSTNTTKGSGDTHQGVVKTTDAINSKCSCDSNSRSFITEPAATSTVSQTISTATTTITTTSTNTPNRDNTAKAATTTHTPLTRTGSVEIVPRPPNTKQTQKPGTLSHPDPSSFISTPSPSSIVKTSRFLPSSSVFIATTPPPPLDHPDKSPIYHSRSLSSSLLLLSSSSPLSANNDNDKDGVCKNNNRNKATPEIDSTNSPKPLKPPTPKKPSVFISSSNSTTKSKFQRSKKDEPKKDGKESNNVNDGNDNNDDQNIQILTAAKSSKDNFKTRVFERRLPTKTQELVPDSITSSSRKQLVSPSPSSSSGSSSKLNRVGTGSGSNGGSGNTTRQKKLSKRGHPHRRARSKSERRHKSSHHHHHHHEEKTRYYFSSDLSDIDVIEVEDWETYSSARARDGSGTGSASGKSDKTEKRRRFDRSGSNSKSGGGASSMAEDSEDPAMIQEVYSIPPSSSEIRRASGGVVPVTDGSASSPQMSPDIKAKLPKKSKKTDTIYKWKKNNNNKLLSDLIIRNYDRQMYEVGGNNTNNNNGVNINSSGNVNSHV